MAAIISNNTNSTHTKQVSANFVDDIEILKNEVKVLSGRIDGLTAKTNTTDTNLTALKQNVEQLDSKYYPINSVYMTTAGINPKDVLKFGEWQNIGPVPGAPEDLMVWKRMK